MAERYLFFNSTQTDRRRYQANDIAEYWASFLTSGLIHEDGQPQLSITANGINRIITVNAGRALIQGHLYLNDETMLKVEEPDALFDRIDRIVIRYDNSIENRYIKAFVKKGEVNENPIAPGLTRENDIYEISLAQIKIVGGKSFIEQADITDERLDINLCGLASSLVKVPTNIFDEQFKAYMAQIADEWRSWYSNVIDASYITGETFAEHNRQVDRQLANLNAIADIDNRAIGNTGKFYDLFDGSNDMSVAKLDKNKAKISSIINIGDKSAIVYDATDLAIGKDYTIVGVSVDGNTELNYQKNIIASITGNTITFIDAFLYKFATGSLITRSFSKGDRLSNELTLDSWANAIKGRNLTTGAITTNSSDRGEFTCSKYNNKYMMAFSKFFALNKTTGYYVEATVDASATDSVLFCGNGIDNLGKVIKITGSSGIAYLNILDESTMTFASIGSISTLARVDTNYYSSTSVISHLSLNGKDYIATVIGALGATASSIKLYEITATSILEIASISFSGNRNSPTSASILNANGKITIVAITNDTINNLKIFEYDNTAILKLVKTQTVTATAISGMDVNYPGGSSNSAPKKMCVLACKNHSLTTVFYRNGEYVVKESPSILLPYPLARPNLSADGDFMAFGQNVYAFNGNDWQLVKTMATAINWLGNELMSYPARGIPFVYTNSKTFTTNNIVARYNFAQPTKNIALWLTTKTTLTNIKASLSQTNTNEVESYTELPVTQNGLEYEFMKVDGVTIKDKTTLKIEIEGTADLEKLLGAIE